MNTSKLHVVVTGGHPAPAIGFIDYIKSHSDATVSLIGRKYNNDRESSLSYEYKEMALRNVTVYHLRSGRLTRELLFTSVVDSFRIVIGIFRSFMLLYSLKPTCVMSFGGYLALPVAIAAWFLRVPVFTHEQTIKPGLANKCIAWFANKVFVSFPESKQAFNLNKTILSGNIIRKEIFKTNKPYVKEAQLPVIYVTGGSLGSHSINVIIEAIIAQLLEKYIIVHQVGNVQEFDDLNRLLRLKESFSLEVKKNYIVVDHVSTTEIGNIYAQSDLVISRSGANTTFELIAHKKPCILFPLPWSANNEQQLHAEILVKANVGHCFDQEEKPERILQKIEHMMDNLGTYKKNYQSLQYLVKTNAEKTIFNTIFEKTYT